MTIEEVEDMDSPARVAQRSPTPLHGGIIESIYDKGPTLPADKSKKSKVSLLRIMQHYFEQLKYFVYARAEPRTPSIFSMRRLSAIRTGRWGLMGSHYQCYHGARKVCSVWKSMKYNLTGALSIV
jgi:hypothetical protein